MQFSRGPLTAAAVLGVSLTIAGCIGQAAPTAPSSPGGVPTPSPQAGSAGSPGTRPFPLAPGGGTPIVTAPTPGTPTGTATGVPLTPSRRYMVTTYAGSTQGATDGPRERAQFNYPSGIAIDHQGNLLVSAQGSTRLRRLSTAGEVTTLVGGEEGYQDGPLATARFSHPINLAVDRLGIIFVADAFGSHRIRRVDLASGVTTLAGGTQGFADGPALQGRLNNPTALAVTADGSIYIADAANDRIRLLSTDGRLSTLAGGSRGFADGNGSEAQFNNPTGVALDADGTLFVSDSGNHRIRRVLPTGTVTTVAGSVPGDADGAALSAQFKTPLGLTFDRHRNLLIVDSFNHRIRALTPAGQVVTLAGSVDGFAEGIGSDAKFSSPFGVAASANGDIYVTDMANFRIRRLQPMAD